MKKRDKKILVKKRTPEQKENIRQGHIGIKFSPEACESIRKASIGRKQSKESIEKTRQKNLGKKRTQEQNERNRQIHLGKPSSKLHIFSALDHLCKDKYCILFNNSLREKVRIRQ